MSKTIIRLDAQSLAYLEYLQKNMRKDVLYAVIFSLFDRQSQIGAGFIAKNFVAKRMKMHSNTLAKNITGRAEREKTRGVPSMRIGVFRSAASPYAGVQELGTKDKNPASPYDVIKPIGHPGLAMPVGDALFPSGIPRYSSPRKYPGELHFIPFRRGIAIGALYDDKEWKRMAADRKRQYKRSKRFPTIFHSLRDYHAVYLLLKQTSIAPKYWLRDGFEAFLVKLAAALAETLLQLMVGPGKGGSSGQPA